MKYVRLGIVVFSIMCHSLLFGQLDSIFIYCDTNLFQKIHTEYLEDNYIECDVNYSGTEYNAKMRIRGSSSREYPKKSLKIKYSHQQRTHTINLNADYLDQSYMHQYLSSNLYKMIDQTVFSCEHKAVFLNNEFLGIYLEVEFHKN